MARFIPYHPKAGTPEAKAWAERMKKARLAKKIRRAGQKTERRFFTRGGKLKANPKGYHNIEKSGFRRGEYVGYGGGVWRISKWGKSSWKVVLQGGGGKSFVASSFDEISRKLDALAKSEAVHRNGPGEVAELYNWAVNDGSLYRQVEDKLLRYAVRQFKAGQWNTDNVLRHFIHWASEAARRYAREAGGTVSQLFTRSDLQQVALDRVNYWHREFTLGNFPNPGAKWHDGAAQVAAYRGKQLREPIEKALYKGMEVAHRDSAQAARRLGMNPANITKKDTAYLQRKGWVLTTKGFARSVRGRFQYLERVSDGWRVSTEFKTFGASEPVVAGVYPLLADAAIVADKILEGRNPPKQSKRGGVLIRDEKLSPAVSMQVYQTSANRFTVVLLDKSKFSKMGRQVYGVYRSLERANEVVDHWIKSVWTPQKAERERYGIKDNPIAVYNPPKVAGVIYNKAIEIRAQKTDRLFGRYKHVFGPNVQILGLDNGDVLLHHRDGKPLWITKKAYDAQQRH